MKKTAEQLHMVSLAVLDSKRDLLGPGYTDCCALTTGGIGKLGVGRCNCNTTFRIRSL